MGLYLRAWCSYRILPMCLEEAVSPISHVDLLALLYLTITGGSST